MNSASQDRIRVMIVDDHAVVRRGLAIFLRAFPHLELVGEASDGKQAVGMARDIAPDVILMDLVMPCMDGVLATKALRAAVPAARVLALTSFAEDRLVEEALRAGADGYLMKDVSPTALEHAILRVCSGETALGETASRALLRAMRRPCPRGDDLTKRERQVLALVVSGKTNAQIASSLMICKTTVKTHITNILGKLGVTNRTQAAAVAVETGIDLPNVSP